MKQVTPEEAKAYALKHSLLLNDAFTILRFEAAIDSVNKAYMLDDLKPALLFVLHQLRPFRGVPR